MTHWIRLGISVALIISGYSIFFKGLSQQFQIQDEINAKLPHAEKFEPLFWWLGTWQKFRRLEAEHLPGSQRLKKVRLLCVGGLVQVLLGILLGAKTLIG